MLLETAGFPSFLWPDDIALCTYTNLSSSVHPLVDTSAASYEWRSHERRGCRSLSELVIAFPSDKYPRVGFPGQMGALFVVFRGNATLSPDVTVPVYNLANSYKIPSSPDSSLSFFVSL